MSMESWGITENTETVEPENVVIANKSLDSIDKNTLLC